MDTTTHKVKITIHVVFDEAGHTIPPSERTLIQQNLQQDITMSEAHRQPDIDTDVVLTESQPTLHVQKLIPHATLPTRATEEAAGYDLYSAVTLIIPANQMASVSTGLAMRPPQGTYCQILPRSDLLKHYGVEPKAGVIDPDYTGDITILMSNNTDEPYTINIGDRIAQMVIYNITHPKIHQGATLPSTARWPQGFGHTGYTHTVGDSQVCMARHLPASHPNADTRSQYNIWLSTHPFHKILSIKIPVSGSHPTLGMVLSPTLHKDRIQLLDIEKGTPGAKTP
jgi:dUTP pyrophosphatase